MTYLSALIQWILFIPFYTFMGMMGTFEIGAVALVLIFLGAAVLQWKKPQNLTRKIWQWIFSVLGAWFFYIWFLFLTGRMKMGMS